jgi:O-antigen ligase
MAFLMAFPVILIAGQNITVFLFLAIWIRFGRFTNVFRISSRVLFIPLLFGFGAILSVLNIVEYNAASIPRSLAVLPNYLYWCFLILMLVNLKNYINLNVLARYTAMGVVVTIVYYFSQGALSPFRFVLNYLSPNSFSFILICFTVPGFIYLATVKKSKALALIYLLISVAILISEGRRAGTVLVLVPSVIALVFTKIEVKRLALGISLFTIVFLFMQTPAVEALVKSANPRIYGLLYETEDIATEDRSFLVRQLQLEKALFIYQDYPYTGIGLNNFTNFDVNFKGDFEGSELVMHKPEMNEKSAHNSYASLLAEGGLFLLVPFLFLIVINMYHFIVNYNKRSQIENAYFWSFIGMCIHLYFISGILNVYAWFLIGIVTMLTVKYANAKS